MIREVQCKQVLTFHSQAFPTNWDLNPYRGCTIGCRYCFAQYSHKYLGLENFFSDIQVKMNVAERLAVELSKRKLRQGQIKIGGTTDVYQQAEKKYMLMPEILKVLTRFRVPVFIQTKSDLILRDTLLIRELAKVAAVDISTSISTLDESIRKIVEPGSSPALKRIEMLSQFNNDCRSTTLGFMPVIPLLSDTDENLEAVFRLAGEHRIDNVVTSFLFLRGEMKPKFFEMMRDRFPALYPSFTKLYRSSRIDEGYAREMQYKIDSLRKKYNQFGVYRPVETGDQTEQLSLF